MDVALLVNPVARGGAAVAAGDRAARRLRAGGVRTTFVAGVGVAGQSAALRAALDAGADAVVAVGGDGTVHVALQEIGGTDVPLGIIPCGTGNDLARSLGLRARDAEAAADVVLTGATRTLDLARATGADGASRLFATVLASGFDSRVNDRANRMRFPRGASRYSLAILAEVALLAGAAYRADLELADGSTERVDGELLLAAVGNVRTYGGGIPISPAADPTDGLLDVVLVRALSRTRLVRLLPRVYRGTHLGIREVSSHRVRAVTLASPAGTAYADGDALGPLPMRIEVLPRALTVFAPVR